MIKKNLLIEIKLLKELFDTGILNQEEYDKLVAKYKAIIMAN